MKRIDNGIETRGQWFVVQRPDGRCSRYIFRNPFRAAEHVMKASAAHYWPDLARRGVRVISFWPDSFADPPIARLADGQPRSTE